MDRNKKLMKNTVIYFIGNISTKLISFLLLPLYTSYLTPYDYGKVDLVFTYTSIIIPIMTLQITFAGFRYLFDTEDLIQQKSVISNTIAINLLGMSIFGILYIILLLLGALRFEFGLLIIMYVMLNSLFSSLQQLTRGLKKNGIYSFVGVLSTLVQLVSNAIFIVGLGYKSKALLLSPIIAFAISIIYVFFAVKMNRYIDLRLINENKIKLLLQYSIPLVPDAICWWLLLGFGRMFLSYSHGVDAVGIYAVANKFPSILTMLYSIFNLAWQENSFSEYDKKDRDIYYSDVYNRFLKFIMPTIIIAIPLTKIFSKIIIGKSFSEAYLFIPILYLSVCISMLSSFYGAGFESAKKTKGILISTLYAMIINVIFNLILTPKFSISGVCFALLVSNVMLLLSRIRRSKSFFLIDVDKKPVFFMAILTLIVFTFHYLDVLPVQIILIFIGLVIFIYYNKYLILKLKCCLKL